MELKRDRLKVIEILSSIYNFDKAEELEIVELGLEMERENDKKSIINNDKTENDKTENDKTENDKKSIINNNKTDNNKTENDKKSIINNDKTDNDKTDKVNDKSECIECIESEDRLIGFNGIVYKDRCKAVVYNHGLYTQCKNKCDKEFCSSLCKKLKYGHIDRRKEYPLGTYILENGKREIKMSKILRRLDKKRNERIITEDSEEELVVKRGRPKHEKKKIEYREDDEELEKVLVKRVTIDGKIFYKSENDELYEIE